MSESTAARVKRWSQRLARSKHVVWLLFWASFAETLVVPIPIELLLIPYMVAHRERLWVTAAAVTAGCLCAALLGYGIGLWFFDTLGQQLIGWAQWSDAMTQFREMFGRYGFWAIVAIGVLPIPFQVALLAAGAAAYPVALFMLAVLIARGIRYFGLALLVRQFGDRAEALWQENRIKAMLIAGALVLVAALIAQAA